MIGSVAKTGDLAVDRRYLVEEHLALVIQATVLTAAALADQPDL
ncbi:MAG: hypothetical protein ACM3ZF_16275 [Mycobacterium leprae]